MKNYTELQKELIGALVGLARSLDETNSDFAALNSMICGLNALDTATPEDINAVREAKRWAVPDCSVCQNPCGKTRDYDLEELQRLPPEIAELKYELIEKIRYYAKTAEFDQSNYKNVLDNLVTGLFAVGYDYFNEEQLGEIIQKVSDDK